jgi:hypothetical protein
MSNNVSSKSKLTLVVTKIITFKSVEEPKIKKFRIITIDLEVIRALNSDRYRTASFNVLFKHCGRVTIRCLTVVVAKETKNHLGWAFVFLTPD